MGLSIPQLLVASDIVPWSVDIKNRTKRGNGLCLNALHDRAFDCGLLTVTTDLRVKLSSQLKRKRLDEGFKSLFFTYDHCPISLPRHFAPDVDFLRYHNEKIFLSS